MISLAALALFHIVTYAWPFLPGKVQTYTEFGKPFGPLGSSHVELSDLFLYIFNSTEEPVGCNIDKHAWCADLAPVNVSCFIAAGWDFTQSFVTLGLALLRVLHRLRWSWLPHTEHHADNAVLQDSRAATTRNPAGDPTNVGRCC